MTDPFDAARDLPTVPLLPGETDAAIAALRQRRRKARTGLAGLAATAVLLAGTAALAGVGDQGQDLRTVEVADGGGHERPAPDDDGATTTTQPVELPGATPEPTAPTTVTTTAPVLPPAPPPTTGTTQPPREEPPRRGEMTRDRTVDPDACRGESTPPGGTIATGDGWCTGAAVGTSSRDGSGDGRTAKPRPVPLHVGVCRAAGEATGTLTFSSGLEADVAIRPVGSTQELWRWSDGVAVIQSIHHEALAGTECLVWTVAWDGVGRDGRPVPPGEYELVASVEANEVRSYQPPPARFTLA